ncbi:hypothetical protein E2C01_099568 [Portunus trituberculatus]|uniref:Uncharacterized protein n=1 Tax=Portunus trituberculatus TaxID=210409 RepID=A0A5B7K465_PORTR|nr:hypothetical protein [Portunus trituberculatus]
METRRQDTTSLARTLYNTTRPIKGLMPRPKPPKPRPTVGVVAARVQQEATTARVSTAPRI